MHALIIMILVNYPRRPVEVYYTRTEIFATQNLCDQRLRSAINEAQAKYPDAMVRGACVPALAGAN
jgi:hypothetical protein